MCSRSSIHLCCCALCDVVPLGIVVPLQCLSTSPQDCKADCESATKTNLGQSMSFIAVLQSAGLAGVNEQQLKFNKPHGTAVTMADGNNPNEIKVKSQ